VLVSWDGGFFLATASKIRKFQTLLELFTFHIPKMVAGKQCGFALRIYKQYQFQFRELVSAALDGEF
jgi:hypothetical protein